MFKTTSVPHPSVVKTSSSSAEGWALVCISPFRLGDFALCEIVGGIAIFLSPTVVYLAKFSPIPPLLILGLCSLLGALATFFLPETAGQELPQTLRWLSH